MACGLGAARYGIRVWWGRSVGALCQCFLCASVLPMRGRMQSAASPALCLTRLAATMSQPRVPEPDTTNGWPFSVWNTWGCHRKAVCWWYWQGTRLTLPASWTAGPCTTFTKLLQYVVKHQDNGTDLPDHLDRLPKLTDELRINMALGQATRLKRRYKQYI